MSVSRIDPAAKAMIDRWLIAMNQAAGRGDAETITELARRVTDTIEQQQRWQREQQWDMEYDDDADDDDDDVR
jgi:hypothetical protein